VTSRNRKLDQRGEAVERLERGELLGPDAAQLLEHRGLIRALPPAGPEERELRALLGRPAPERHPVERLPRLQRREHAPRARHDAAVQPGQPRHLDAVGAARSARRELAQEDDLALPLLHRHVEVAHLRPRLGQGAQLVVVRGEEALGAYAVVQVLGHRPGDADAVVGGGAAADLVDHHQAA